MSAGRLAALVLFALVSFALVACGSAGSTPGDAANALDLVRSARAETADEGSFTFDMTIQVDVPAVGPVAIRAEGAADYSEQFTRMSMEMGPDFESDVIVSGTDLYMRSNAFDLAALADRWLLIDLDDDVLAELGGTAAWTTQDPANFLDVLAGAETVDEVGEERLNGVTTTRYHVVFEVTAETLEEQGVPSDYAHEAATMFAELTGNDRFEGDVWIDEQGLPAQVRFEFEIAPAPGIKGGPVVYEMRFFDWGEPIDMSLPSDAETIDFQEFLGQAAP